MKRSAKSAAVTPRVSAKSAVSVPPIGPPASSKPWLVMVYMAGDNNLTEEMVLALQDLMQEGPPADDIIVVQFDTSGVGLEALRYVFTKPDPGPLTGTPIGMVNTGSAEALKEFIIQAATYDVKNNMQWLLVLSGHGGGTSADFLLKDDNAQDALSIAELKEALKAATTHVGRKIDILGMDACFMSMGEVAYEVRHFADVLVGAEGLEPAFGWPYRRLLAWAKASVSTGHHHTPKQLASAIVSAYITHYQDYDETAGRSADLSATDLTRLDPVAHAFTSVVNELTALDEAGHNLVVLAHWYAQTFKFDQYVDLVDFCEQLKRHLDRNQWPALHTACDAVIASVDVTSAAGSTIATGWSGFSHQHSHGLSIYFPWALLAEDYRKLEFAVDTGWPDFVERHLEVTRREERTCGAQPAAALAVVAATPGRSADEITSQVRVTRDEKLKRIKELKRLARTAEPVPSPAEEATRRRLRSLRAAVGLRSVDRAIVTTVLSGVVRMDEATAIAGRLLGGRSFRLPHSRFSTNTRFSVNTRFSINTRFSDNTRSLDSLESSIKNLPLIIRYCVQFNSANLP